MNFIVQRDWPHSARAATGWYSTSKKNKFAKFNHAMAALRQQKGHARLVFQDNDGSLTTIILFESDRVYERYAHNKTRPFTKINGKLYISTKLLRKTSRRRK